MAMTTAQIRSSFRRIDPSRYPELIDYARDAIYGDGDRMAPGGLYLAARMTRSLNLQPGDVVLDLGCGRGDSSLFLARHFDVHVVSVDLLISATERSEKFAARGHRHDILPLRLDARRPLPFGEQYFDAIFCMQALHAFGGSVSILQDLLKHLKPGGRFVVGTTCFNEPVTRDTLPDIYRQTDGWDAEYEKYHWPEWWNDLFIETGMLDVIECEELDDGALLWEDDVLYSAERAGWRDTYVQNARWLIDQLVFGRTHRPYLTHFVATAVKKLSGPLNTIADLGRAQSLRWN